MENLNLNELCTFLVSQKISIDKPKELLIAVVLLIFAISKFMLALQASEIETILMNKGGRWKRIFSAYIVMLGCFVVANYCFTLYDMYVIIGGIYCILCMLVYAGTQIIRVGFKIIIKKEKFSNCIKILEKMLLAGFFPLAIVDVARSNEINIFSCIIIGSFLEVLMFTVYYGDEEHGKSRYFIEVDGEKWFVCRKKGDFLLCGNENRLKESTRVKLIQMKEVSELRRIIHNEQTNKESVGTKK